MYIELRSGGHIAQAKLLQTRISERIDAVFSTGGMTVTLVQDAALGGEDCYQIVGSGNDWRIIGSDERGIYYGIGKFLHSASWQEDCFIPHPTDGVVSPACNFRCVYYAIHFHNWYQEAPLEELTRYVEDMLLYGYNAIDCIIPVIQFNTLDDPLFHSAVKAARTVFTLAKNLGMKTSLNHVPNQGMITAPHVWDADGSFDRTFRGFLGRNICPSKPGALEYLRGIWIKFLEQFLDIGLDYLIAWPYDEGGCGCAACAPWGAGGFEKLNRVLACDLKRLYPDAKLIYSTWAFDAPYDQLEYSTLYKRLAAGEMDYVDYLMTDAHGSFPRYPLEHPVIKPIVNFPEISMWALYPWGGFGANPLPKRFEEFWDSSKAILSGGMPYSEGIYEDISKVQYAGYYWNKDARYTDTLQEYAEYEFGAGAGEDAVRLMELIEKNHVQVHNVQSPDLAAAQEALSLAQKIDARLSEKQRKSWRWRILYIRAMLDAKRYAAFYEKNMTVCSDDLHTLWRENEKTQILKDDPEAQALYRELRGIYHTLDHDSGDNRWTLPIVQGAM